VEWDRIPISIKKEILSFATCIGLKNIMLIETSQAQKSKYHILPHLWNMKKLH
jgi:hypothetical protein